MNETMLKLRIWARAETTLARIHVRRSGQRVAFLAVAVGLTLLAVAMVNVGAYVVLAERFGRANGAFALAGANAVLATLLVALSQRTQSRPEEDMVREIRELAVAELAADAEEVKKEFNRLSGHVRRIEDGLSALSGGGAAGGLAMISTVGPVLEMIVKTLRDRQSR